MVAVLQRLAAGQGGKHLGGLGSQPGIGSHQAQVGIEFRGLFIVVAGADLGDIAQALVGVPGDQAQLGVDLVFRQAVDDPAAGVLQQVGHLDVVLLVKPGPQLHEDGDFLAVLGGLDEGLYHLAVGGHPVEGHFNGNHRVVLGGLLEQLQEGPHALKGIGQQHILLLNLRDDALLQIQGRGQPGAALGVEQVALAAQIVLKLGDEGQVQRGGGLEHMAQVNVQIARQLLAHFFAHGPGELQPHRGQPLALADQVLHVVPVVQIFVIGGDGVDIRVAGDPHDGFFPQGVLAVNLGQEVEATSRVDATLRLSVLTKSLSLISTTQSEEMLFLRTLQLLMMERLISRTRV